MEKLNFSNMDGNKLSELVDPLINEDIDDLVGYNNQRFDRCQKTIVDYWFSNWGHWLRNPKIRYQNSKIAKSFILPFHSFPFHSIPFHSIPFRSISLVFFNFLSLQFDSSIFIYD